MSKAPTGVTIFSYQVGFGDCFLLRFSYPGKNRHVLIDFGSTGLPEGAPRDQMMRIAKDIAAKCGKRLEAVVATHRHRDHISGFATKKGKGTGDIIKALNPRVVIQPWTEDPKLAKNAQGPVLPKGGQNQLKAFAHSRSIQQDIARQAMKLAKDPPAGFPKYLIQRLAFLGEDNLANKSAVTNLMTMVPKPKYIFFGAKSGLEGVLPGVKVTVLGPPTLRQTETIRKMTASKPDEFWQLHLRRLTKDSTLVAKKGDLFPDFESESGGKLRFSARWLASRIKEMNGEQMLQLVRILDAQMNNTSVILLFQVGKKKLLFPGDAQIENWDFALSKPSTRKLLAGVDLYKVGHHGSRNATPRTMWDMFDKRGAKSRKGRMRSVLSTMPGKHGSAKAKTEVPRQTLLQELDSRSELHNTDALPNGQLFQEIKI